ncbi:LADA_0E02036g1_1 [Lachancea dasiensis]|uniref:DNA repair protein RAD5 n=1 Tax=Lachancea dasiensis TaxID=1072105 RepID=A0A1G4JAY1_9SACH|nr:LADA_0E02036g1_1 [Lachancea dasiensis]
MNSGSDTQESVGEYPVKKRFFNDDLDTNREDPDEHLDNQDSLLFQTPIQIGSNESSNNSNEVKELQELILGLSDADASKLLANTDPKADKSTRLSDAVGVYFEQQLSIRKPKSNSPKTFETSWQFPWKKNRKRTELDQSESSTKKPRSSVEWRRFIGSVQVTALATRPTAKPLKYGGKLTIKQSSPEVSSKLYYSNGRKRASMANFVRLIDIELGREVGRVPEEIATILFPFIGSNELNFEITMIYCNNKRLSVGDSFIVQLDCFLTSVVFDSSLNGRVASNTSSPEKRGFSQNVIESEEELRQKGRRLAFLSLFDRVKLQYMLSENEGPTENISDTTEVIDLDEDDVDAYETDVSDFIKPTQIQEDVLNVNQLKSLYKATLSMESLKNLPETDPSPDVFKLTLRRFQKQGLTWLLRREREFDESTSLSSEEDVDGDMMNPLWKQFRWPKDLSWEAQKKRPADLKSKNDDEFFYANLHTGEFSQTKPILKSLVKGGILADEMGLGKTISMLSLVLSVPHDKKYNCSEQMGESNTPSIDLHMSDYVKPYAYKTTLVVVPMSLLSQWQHEFEKSVSSPDIHCEIYYGGNNGNVRKLLTQVKTPPSVLLTTYGTVQHEWSRLTNKTSGQIEPDDMGLFSVEYFRVVLDEGHTIRNRNTKTSKSLMDLSSARRWILTGTPIINRLDDLYSMVKFLRLEPWSQVGYWKTFVSEPFEKKNYKSAFDVVSSILDPVLLRRTKQMRDVDGNRLVELPPKEIIVEKVSFNRHEDALYKYFLNRAESSVKEGLDRGDLLKKYSTILVHILRLRQVCCHADLLGSQDENDEDLAGNKMLRESFNASKAVSNEYETKALVSDEEVQEIVGRLYEKYPDQNKFRDLECSICTSEPIDPVTQTVFTECGHPFCEMCILEYVRFQSERQQEIKCPNCRSKFDPKRLTTVKESSEGGLSLVLYDTGSKSSKITSLMKSLKRLQDACPGEQVMVFSQFSSYLDIMEKELCASFSKAELIVYKFDGRLSMKERSRVLEEFAEKDLSKLKVLLLSLKAGGVGLNLTCASKAYMMDPWWSPSLEDQAIDRIHRIGQVNNVKVIRFIMEHSIEEKMLRIQERKRTLGEAVDADEDERRKRRIEEIRMLFE